MQIDLAPVTIFWYGDTTFANGAQDRLKELVDLGALPVTHGWTHPYVDDLVYPQVLEPLSKDALATTWAVSVESGLAIAQAMLAAVDEGLGVGLHAFNAAGAKEVLKVPDTWVPMWILLVGYPAEDAKGGGQRPRRPLSESLLPRPVRHPVDGDSRGHRAAQARGDDPGTDARRRQRADEGDQATRRPLRAAVVTSGGIESQASVKQWAAGAGFDHDPAEVREGKLRILVDFCTKVEKQPDELVAFCILRKKATGERFLSVKRREAINGWLDEFAGEQGWSRETGGGERQRGPELPHPQWGAHPGQRVAGPANRMR